MNNSPLFQLYSELPSFLFASLHCLVFFLRKLENGGYLLCGQVDIPLELLTRSRPIEYKYCLHKKRTPVYEKRQLVYEYVIWQGKHDLDINRKLKIPQEEWKRVKGEIFVLFFTISR